MKYTVSLAVMMLLGESQSRTHTIRHEMPGAYDFIEFVEEDADEIASTAQSIAESEKLHKAKFIPGDDLYQQSLAMNNKLNFKEDELIKNDRIDNSMQKQTFVGLSADNMFIPQSFMQSESDPIHGSLGPPPVKMEDLTPEQQFEEGQRRMPPAKYTPSEDVVTTDNSIKIAEELVGDKMASPTGPDAKVYAPWAKYHLHTADEEEEDTKETRRSVKTVEKELKTRFWINAREKKDYDKMVAEGKISDAELEFKEGKDADIGQDQAKVAEAEEAAKGEAKAGAEAKAADAAKSPEEKKAAETLAVAGEAAEQADSDLPPELAAPALSQTSQWKVRI